MSFNYHKTLGEEERKDRDHSLSPVNHDDPIKDFGYERNKLRIGCAKREYDFSDRPFGGRDRSKEKFREKEIKDKDYYKERDKDRPRRSRSREKWKAKESPYSSSINQGYSRNGYNSGNQGGSQPISSSYYSTGSRISAYKSSPKYVDSAYSKYQDVSDARKGYSSKYEYEDLSKKSSSRSHKSYYDRRVSYYDDNSLEKKHKDGISYKNYSPEKDYKNSTDKGDGYYYGRDYNKSYEMNQLESKYTLDRPESPSNSYIRGSKYSKMGDKYDSFKPEIAAFSPQKINPNPSINFQMPPFYGHGNFVDPNISYVPIHIKPQMSNDFSASYQFTPGTNNLRMQYSVVQSQLKHKGFSDAPITAEPFKEEQKQVHQQREERKDVEPERIEEKRLKSNFLNIFCANKSKAKSITRQLESFTEQELLIEKDRTLELISISNTMLSRQDKSELINPTKFLAFPQTSILTDFNILSNHIFKKGWSKQLIAKQIQLFQLKSQTHNLKLHKSTIESECDLLESQIDSIGKEFESML